jgi:hypothetical protein
MMRELSNATRLEMWDRISFEMLQSAMTVTSGSGDCSGKFGIYDSWFS